MSPNNPACYECPKGKNKLHWWQKHKTPDGTLLGANCINCDLFINRQFAIEVYTDNEKP